MKETAFKGSEADLCAGFIAAVVKDGSWTAYPETAGFDILLVRATDGAQIGIEAKLALNAKVVSQALPGDGRWYSGEIGPDYRAVLVPADKCNADLKQVCAHVGITVITYRGPPENEWSRRPDFYPFLPKETAWSGDASDWHEWLPSQRCPVPDYVPDVIAGASAPVSLTAWKVKAIRLAVLLEERAVTRADFKHLQLSPTFWTGPNGCLSRTAEGYIAGPHMPNLRAQHPRNYDEIRADKARWAPSGPLPLAGCTNDLLGAGRG